MNHSNEQLKRLLAYWESDQQNVVLVARILDEYLASGGGQAALSYLDRVSVDVLAIPDVMRRKGVAHMVLAEWQLAEKCFRQVLERQAGDPVTLYNLATIKFNCSQFAEAVSILRAIEHHWTQLPGILQVLAHCEFVLGNTSAAISTLNKRMRLGDENKEILSMLAFLHSVSKEYAAAIYMAETVLKVSPDDEQSLIAYTNSAIGLLKLDEGLQICRKAVEIHKNSGILWLNKGQLEMLQGLLSDSELSLRTASALLPDGEADNLLGLVLARLGKLDEAENTFLLALEQYPDSASSAAGSALISFLRGDLEAAEKIIQLNSLHNSREPLAQIVCAMILDRNGNPEALVKVTESLLSDIAGTDALLYLRAMTNTPMLGSN